MNIFRRIFKIGQAETHSLIDKLENPIKLTEQGIRDMKIDLDKSLQALAEVKAMAIRAKREAESLKQQAESYEKKAIELIERAKGGQIDPAEADRLAETALGRQQECVTQRTRELSDAERFEASIAKLDVNIKKLRVDISKWENELKTLRARATVSEATKNVNKQMAMIDSSSTVAMLERMKLKVEKDEALADSYAEIANEARSVDEEIDKALNTPKLQASEALKSLKDKLYGKVEEKPAEVVTDIKVEEPLVKEENKTPEPKEKPKQEQKNK